MTEQQLHLVQPAVPLLFDLSVAVFTPFSQTPARDVLMGLPHGTTDAAALFLGCADGSCLLASLAARHPGLTHLAALLNDSNPLLLAKAALILLMAAELDPDSQIDMQVLWEVWYCALWGPATLLRVKPFIERLQQGSVPWLSFTRPEDKQTLEEVWSWWLRKDKPSVAKVNMWRDNLKKKMHGAKLSSDWKLQGLVKMAVPQMVKIDSFELVEQALKDVRAPPGTTALEHVLQHDMATWCETGCLSPNYHAQQPVKPLMANLTMLRPESLNWRCKMDTSPALCWGPFSAAELQSAIKSGSSAGIIARTCIAHITHVVRNFQAHTCFNPAASGQDSSRVRLQVQLVCMDALQLCLGMPLTVQQGAGSQAMTAPEAHTLQNEAAPTPAQLFDVIDAGTIADRCGLLALLVSAKGRLRPLPHARLYTGLKDWCGNLNQASVEQSVCIRSLCMPVTLMPTILGLRLLNDQELDRPETTGPHDYTYRLDTFRELVWAPIPAELQVSPLPQLQEQLIGGPSGSIEAALTAIATQLCCTAKNMTESSQIGTPQLLAWLLASLSERADMSALLGVKNSGVHRATEALVRHSEEGSSNRRQCNSSDISVNSTSDPVRQRYMEKQRMLWAMRTKVAPLLPAAYQLSFITGIDILRSSLQQSATLNWLPVDVPACQGVTQLRLPFTMQDAWFAKYTHVRSVLVEQQQADSTKSDVNAWAFKGAPPPAGVHITDVWGPRTEGGRWTPYSDAEVFVYLPTDHGLDSNSTQVYLAHMSVNSTLHTAELDTFITPPPTLAQVLLPSACPATASRYSKEHTTGEVDCKSATSHKASWGLHVLSCTETATSYSVVLQFVPTGHNIKSPLWGSIPCMAIETPGGIQVQAGHYLLETGVRKWLEKDCREIRDGVAGQQVQSTSHQVTVRVLQPVGEVLPAELHFHWPVAIGMDEPHVKTSSSEGFYVLHGAISSGADIKPSIIGRELKLKLDLRKAKPWELWTNDEAWSMAPAALDLSQLTAMDQHSKALVDRCTRAQFHPDDYDDYGQEKFNALNNLRIKLSDMMTAMTFDAQMSPGVQFTACDSLSKSGVEWSSMVHLLCHPPVLLTPAGRPVLPVTVVDVSMCEGAIAKGTMSQTSFNQLLKSLGFEPGQVAPFTTYMLDGCTKLRRLLFRRGLACKPTAAQQASLPDGSCMPYYYNSYLSCMQIPTAGYSNCLPKPQQRGHASSYLANRVRECIAEMDAHQVFDQQEAFANELKQLLAQDTKKALPAELRSAAQFRVNWRRPVSGLPGVKDRNFQKPAATGTSDKGSAEKSTEQGRVVVSSQQGSSTKHQSKEASSAAAAAAAGALPVTPGGAPEVSSAHACACCGKSDKETSRCGRCKAVWYCSRECQAADWKQHKRVCKG